MRKEEDIIYFYYALTNLFHSVAKLEKTYNELIINLKIMQDPKQLSTVLIYVSTNTVGRQGEPMLGFTVFRSDFNTTVHVNRPRH